MKRLVHVLIIVTVACVGGGCVGAKKQVQVKESMSEINSASPSLPDSTSTYVPRKVREGSLSWQYMDYPTGDHRTSVISVEKGVPAQVFLNQSFSYQLIVTNLSNQTLYNILIEEKPCHSLKTGSSSSKSSAKSKTASRKLALDVLGPKESKTFFVQATARREGAVTTCTGVSYDPIILSSIPVVQPKLSLKQSGPETVLTCDPITYNFDISNNGSGVAENVSIFTLLPEGLTTRSGAQNIHLSAGSIKPGQHKKYGVTLRAAKKGTYLTRSIATGKYALTTKSDQVKTTVGKPQLKVTYSHPKKLYYGNMLNYNVTIKNTGNVKARNASIKSDLPANAKVIDSSRGGQYIGNQMIWNLGTIPPKSHKTVNLKLLPNKTGIYLNQFTTSTDCFKPMFKSVATTVKGISALHFEVVDVKDPVLANEETEYIITLTNQGSEADHDIYITCFLESNQRYKSSAGPTRVKTEKKGKIIFAPLAKLEPKHKAIYRIFVKNIKEGDVRFKTAITSKNIKRPVEKTEATYIY